MSMEVTQDQSAAIAALSDPALHDGAEPQRIETHANILLIGPERAYKLKRAVRYPFLDYSTPELRYRYCRAEVMLNRRTAPDLYLGVVPIGEQGVGDMVADPLSDMPPSSRAASDHAVVMKRFDDETLFDRLAEKGRLTPDLLTSLGSELARFHKSAKPAEKDWPAVKAEVLEDNLLALEEVDWWPAGEMAAHRARCSDLFDACRPLLAARVAHGHIRECHGDVHLRNVCLVDGKVTLFDCIEFNDDFAHIDTAYDLAFLLMDLEHRGMDREAAALLNRYLEATGDYGAPALLPFYKALRAQIRAKIAVSTAMLAGDEGEAAAQRDEALAYFALACRAASPPPARLIAFGGVSGSGKSTVARGVAAELARRDGAAPVILRSDAIRKSLFGVAETDRLPKEAYRPEVSEKVYRLMEERADAMLRHGVTVILDATYTHAGSRAALPQVAARAGAPFQGIWLDAPEDELVRRVTARKGDVSDADAAVVRKQLEQDFGAIDWTRIGTSGGADAAYSPEKTIELALGHLATG